MNKLFVARLPWAAGKDSLKNYFSKYGEVTESFVVTDKQTGRSKGFGFVTFANNNGVRAALNEQNHELEGRSIVVKPAEERPDAPPRRPRTPTNPTD